MSSDVLPQRVQSLSPGPVRRLFRALNYYKFNIIFPSIAAFLIWADYSRTQEWKAKQAAAAAAVDEARRPSPATDQH